jgi:hypothetical protein
VSALVIEPRSAWEVPGLRIGEHTTSPPVELAVIERTVSHYPALKGALRGGPFDLARAMQAAYVRDRGHSIGYGWLTWPDGIVVELRGWRYRNAANAVKGDDGRTNRTTLSVVHALSGDRLSFDGYAIDELPQPQLEAHWLLVEHIRAVTGRPIGQTVHGQLEATRCAGDGVNDQWSMGVLEPAWPPSPIPPTTKAVPPMILLDYAQPNKPTTVFTWTGTHLAWIENGHADTVLRGVPELPRRSVSRDQLAGIIASAITTTGAPWTLDAQLVNLWTAQR